MITVPSDLYALTQYSELISFIFNSILNYSNLQRLCSTLCIKTVQWRTEEGVRGIRTPPIGI